MSIRWMIWTLFTGVFAMGAAFSAHGAGLSGPLDNRAFGPERSWKAGEKNGSVHCLGNGRLCVYEEGPDILQIFGPSYSTTTIGAIGLSLENGTCVSRRAPGAALWEHRIRVAEEDTAVITDFVDSEKACFIRQVTTKAPLTLHFTPEKGLRLAERAGSFGAAPAVGSLLVDTPIGRPSVPFGEYPIPFAFFHQFSWQGEVEGRYDAERRDLAITFKPGTGTLYIAGGPELKACLDTMDTVLTTDYAALLSRTEAWWADFTRQGRDFAKELPENTPMRERLLQVLDDTAVQIKAQQAVEGGVLAGYPYHLGYVRDQYGVYRGLMAMGHREMARSILDFYFRVFDSFGSIHNAQAFGIPGLFHVHENDEVEITGYITIQALDYLDRTGDKEFIRHIFPMLEWAFAVQQRHLVRHMLPFNGDETYVAGGILPRSALNDGSAEATMLFIDGSNGLIAFAEKEGLWDGDRIAAAHRIVEEVQEAYRENFLREGRFITNNPARCEEAAALPLTRHGVCESCGTVQWSYRTESNRYVCVNCLSKPPLPPSDKRVYTLQSVSLTPLYFHSGLFTKEALRDQIDAIIKAYEATGKLPSRPDGNIAVGYDYGLLLYALTELGDSRAEMLYEKTLSLADDTGAWAEYYRDHQPSGTRCRPWESAINIEALLHWLEKR